MDRLALDIGVGAAVVVHGQTYEVLSGTESGGESSARFTLDYSLPAAVLGVGVTYRIRPSIGFGLEGFAEYELGNGSYAWSNAIGLGFGRRSLYALSAIVEVNPQVRDLGSRHGWFVRGGLGAHWIDDNLRHGPELLDVRRATNGRQLVAAVGFRWAMSARTSLSVQLNAMLQTTGAQAGLLFGGGFQ